MSDDDYGGVGVIERLARFQNPTFEHIVQFQGPGTGASRLQIPF